MKRSPLVSLVLALCTMLSAGVLFAQTNPTPYDLSLGNYAFTDWAATAAAGTYPPNMVFQQSEVIDAPADAPGIANWNCAYNLTSGARINGTGANGLNFINTGTLQCNCAFVGSAVLALNTLNRAQINVSFVAQTIAAGQRVYGLRLQYRLNTANPWLDVMNNGAPVEFRNIANATGTATTISAPLPIACENQSLVQLRWVYYYVPGSGTGTRPQLRLDDISVTSNSTAGTATNLLIERILPVQPSQNAAFNFLVRSTDALGAAKNVTSATTVQITLNSGTGALSGTLTGTIPAGQNQVFMSNVIYNTAQAGVSIRASVLSGQALALANSATFTVLGPPTYATITGAQQTGFAGVPFNPITVQVFRDNTQPDANYGSVITVTRVSGPGVLTGTTSVAAVAGVARFTDLSVTVAGTYQLQVNIPGIPTQTLPFTTAFTAPTMTTDVVPQIIQSRVASGTCNSSVSAFPVPVFARVTFNGLQPNTTYRYVSGLGTDNDLTSVGGGFNVHYNRNDNSFFYTGGKNPTSVGDFSQFSTLAGETSKSIWINLVASTNAAFQEGNVVNWRVQLSDNEGNLINRYQLSQTSQVVRLGTGATQATGLADDNSQLTPKNYVLLYDNTAGTGRPVTVAVVQSIGTNISGAEGFYSVRQNSNSAWATFIPNNLPTGIRRIEERDYRTNAVVYSITSTDGRWNTISTNPNDATSYPSGPGGFTNPIILETPRITLSTPKTGDTLCAGKTATTTFTARGVTNVRVEFSSNNGLNWETVATVGATSGTATWIVPPIEFAGSCRIRVTGVERTDISATSTPFAVASEVVVTNVPESKNLCVGDAHSLIALTSGAVRQYQWFRNDQPIAGANGPLYQITNVQYNSSGYYHCVVYGFGTCGSAKTTTAHIRVARPTQIVQQSTAVAAMLGKKVTLVVEAEIPDEAIAYQWYRGDELLQDGGPIYGANSNRLEIRSVRQIDISNEYRCVVTGVCGAATSKPIRVFIGGVFVEFPGSPFRACENQAVVLRSTVFTSPAGVPLVYQWFRGGVALVDGGKLSGTRTQNLTINGLTSADVGEYVLRAAFATNSDQWAEGTADVAFGSAPVITGNPQSTSVCEGNSVTLSVTATAQGTLQYQWFKDGTVIAGETTPLLTIGNVTQSRAGSYHCRVTTICGTAVSQVAIVTVTPATVITQQPPRTIDVQVGQPLTISIAATGAGTLQYQWFVNGNAIAGEVTPVFSKPAAELADAGSYWCRVRSDCGELISDTAVVSTRPSTTSVEDVLARAGVKVGSVQPNPVVDNAMVLLDLGAPTQVSYAVVSVTGATIFSAHSSMLNAGAHQIVVDASSVASGMYQVVLTINGVTVSRNLSVVK